MKQKEVNLSHFDRVWLRFHEQEETLHQAKGDAYARPDDPLVNYQRSSELLWLMEGRLKELGPIPAMLTRLQEKITRLANVSGRPIMDGENMIETCLDISNISKLIATYVYLQEEERDLPPFPVGAQMCSCGLMATGNCGRTVVHPHHDITDGTIATHCPGRGINNSQAEIEHEPARTTVETHLVLRCSCGQEAPGLCDNSELHYHHDTDKGHCPGRGIDNSQPNPAAERGDPIDHR